MIRKVILILAGISIVSGAYAQGAPPGGVGPFGTWTLESVTRDGRYFGHGYHYVLGIPMEVPFNLPWGSSTGEPQALNTTGEPHLVRARSEGKNIYRFRWSGSSNPPNRVLVLINSSSKAWCSPGGTVSASDGLGSSPITESDYIWAAGSKKKVYDSSRGTFEVEVSTEAEATGLRSAGVEQYGTAEIVIRGLTIGIAGHEGNYRKKMTGRTIWSHGGSYPEAVGELSLPEENSVGELFHVVHVGLPVAPREQYDLYLPYTHIDAGAYAWGAHNPTEIFRWDTPLDSTQGYLPGLFGGYDFGDAGVTNFAWPVKEHDNTITLNGANKFADAAITYTWSDNYTLTSRVRVISRIKVDNHQLFKSIDYTEDDQLTWLIWKFDVLASDPVWTEFEDVSLECTLQPKSAWLQIGLTSAAVAVAAGSEFIGSWPIQLTCMAAGAGLSYIAPPERKTMFTESLQRFRDAIDHTPYYGDWIDQKPVGDVTEETMREYVWQVLALKLYQTDYRYHDKYGDGGYEGQGESTVRWQSSVRYGYRFKKIQPEVPGA